MLGASTFCERAISDQNILLAGVSEQSAIAVTIMLVLELCLVFLQFKE
jgi:hypothetical protein